MISPLRFGAITQTQALDLRPGQTVYWVAGQGEDGIQVVPIKGITLGCGQRNPLVSMANNELAIWLRLTKKAFGQSDLLCLPLREIFLNAEEAAETWLNLLKKPGSA